MPGSAVSTRSRPLGHLVAPVGDDDHARVDRVADPDAAAVMDADPGRAGGDVQQRVQDRPVGDRVGAVLHRLGLAVGRGDRAGVEVVAADHDGCLDLPAPDELVDREPGAGAVAEAEPADSRGQPLERHPLGRERQPALERVVRRERARAASGRWRRCRPDRPRAPPSGTARPRGRTAAGCRPGRSPGRRRRPRPRPPAPPRAGCCRSRRRGCPAGRTRAFLRRDARSTRARDAGTRRGRSRAAPRPPRRRARPARSR